MSLDEWIDTNLNLVLAREELYAADNLISLNSCDTGCSYIERIVISNTESSVAKVAFRL